MREPRQPYQNAIAGSQTTPGTAAAAQVERSVRPEVRPTGRFPGRRPDQAGLDYALSTLADQVHPVR